MGGVFEPRSIIELGTGSGASAMWLADEARKRGVAVQVHTLDVKSAESIATTVGLDVAQFKRDAASEAVKARVDADLAEAEKLGVSGTPAFFINGRYLSGAQPFDAFKRMVDAALEG